MSTNQLAKKVKDLKELKAMQDELAEKFTKVTESRRFSIAY